jgi:hypothetical protein
MVIKRASTTKVKFVVLNGHGLMRILGNQAANGRAAGHCLDGPFPVVDIVKSISMLLLYH